MARRWQPPKQSKSDDRAGPEWSRVLSGMERQAFLAAIQAEMQRRRILAQIFDGYLDGLMPDGTAVKCGFSSLAVACGAARLADYPAVVRAHFDRVLPAVPERAAPPLTFEGLAPRLVAHLYTDEQLRGSKARPITRPLAPGLSAVLAVDFGNAIASLAPESVAHLPQTHDELMAIGVENVGRHRCERDELTLPGGQRAFALSTREPTAASQVLHLGGHLGPPAPGRGPGVVPHAQHAAVPAAAGRRGPRHGGGAAGVCAGGRRGLCRREEEPAPGVRR